MPPTHSSDPLAWVMSRRYSYPVLPAPGVPAAPVKVRDCSHAVLGLSRLPSGSCPTLSLTVMVQFALKTQLTAGAATSTTLSLPANVAVGSATIAAVITGRMTD